MEKQRIGVLTSGGDAPGMNAAIRAVVRTASRQGMECVGIRRGWHGLINSDFVRLDTASVIRAARCSIRPAVRSSCLPPAAKKL